MAITMALALFLGTALYASVRPDVGAPMAALVLLSAVLAGLPFLSSTTATWKSSPLHWPVGLFLAYAVGRYVTSPLEHPARVELLQVGLCVLAYLVAATQLFRARDRAILLATVAVLVVLESAYGLWQCTTRDATVLNWVRPEDYQFRAGGTFVCPNNFATFLIVSLGLLLGYAVIARLDKRAVEQGVLVRLLLIYAALMALVGIIASFSRAGWMAALAALVFFCLWGWTGLRISGRRLAVVVVVLAGILLAAWKAEPVLSRIRKTVRQQSGAEQGVLREASIGGRTHMWKGSWQLITERPLVGHGIGSWQWRYQTLRHPSIQSHPEHAHNDFLHLAAEYGLVGFGLLAWLFVAFYRQAFRLRDPRLPSEQRAFALGAAAGITGALCHAWLDFPFHIPANSLLVALLLGCVAAMEEPEGRPSRQPMAGGARFALGAAFLILPILLAWLYVPTAFSAHYADAGNQAKIQQVLNREVAQALYEKAVRWDPRYPEPHWKLGDLSRSQAVWMMALSPDKAAEGRRLAGVAVAHYQRALDLNPYSTEVLLRQGAALELLGQPDRALANYERAVALSPANAYNHNVLGRFYRKQGDEKRALEHLERAQVLNHWSDISTELNLIEMKHPEPAPEPPR
jgi:O-antigen ligase